MDPLKNKYTYWQRLVHKFKARRDIPFRRKFFVGYDLHGNTYWEFCLRGDSSLRRIVEPHKPLLFKADYYSSIPPQWIQWLRRTRPHAPTLEELINDQVRQQKIKYLAQQAEEKWLLEKQRLELDHQAKLQRELDRAKSSNNKIEQENEDPWKKAEEESDKPQAASIKPRR